MNLVSLSCPRCNAPLEVDTDAGRFTCQFCGATAAVDQGGHTRLIQAVKREVLKDLHAARAPANATHPARNAFFIAGAIASIVFLLSGLFLTFSLMRTSPPAKVAAAIVRPPRQPDNVISPPTPVPPAAPKPPSSLSLDQSPLLADVNGDGEMDLIVSQENRWHGYDGRSGERLFVGRATHSFKRFDYGVQAVVRERILHSTPSGLLVGFAWPSGAQVFEVQLGEVVEKICAAEENAAVQLKNKQWVTVDLKTGNVKPRPGTVSCQPVFSSNADEQPDQFIVDWTEYERYGIPRAVRTKEGTLNNMGRSLVPRNSKARYLLGQRETGTPVPMVARFEAGQLKWASVVPEREALQSTVNLTVVHAGVAGHTLLYQYERKQGSGEVALAAFDTETGQRLWDVVTEGCHAPRPLLMGRDVVFFECFGPVEARSVKTGERLFRIGQ